jgi:Copper type II ascorbate-dependent monooxygenase, C-terminal domain
MRTLLRLLPALPLLISACGGGGADLPPLEPGASVDSAVTTPDAGGSVPGPGASSQQPAASAPNPGASGRDAGTPSPDASAGDPATADGAVSEPSVDFDKAFLWSTDEFEVPGGKERYLCFATNLGEDLVANAFSTKGQPFVHHLIFSRSTANDKLGFEECDTAFRSGWQPMFVTGAGSSKLELPSDAGHKLAKGTRLVIQMHLLNTAEEAVKSKVVIQMRRSTHANPRPVNTYILGTATVKLPPGQKTDLTGDCKVRENVQLIAGFPHMHMLGTAMRLEVGPSADSLKEVFKREPFSFDAQNIEALDLKLKSGDLTRITCSYNNTTAAEVTYGESTRNEMCYFIGFAVDRSGQGGCFASIPPFF